jgi:hypothetical protein
MCLQRSLRQSSRDDGLSRGGGRGLDYLEVVGEHGSGCLFDVWDSKKLRTKDASIVYERRHETLT